jgi:F-type H+-transporting ATPase subunit b
MNILFMPTMQTLAMTEGAGGLFDFNATLPLMAIQFILLTVVLTFVFYKPIAKVLESRETFINTNLSQASEKLLQADKLCAEYEAQIKSAKLEAQSVILLSETETKAYISEELAKSKQDALTFVTEANQQLELQKDLAIKQLELQIEELGQLIKEKLLVSQYSES